ncbi:hypothetical protein BGZ49_007862 [Haplosporangium sp. Z 27]|nr:hypothetical protein BGZ49_007862 [Haplosporangium sp. Z 27]
MPRGRPSKPPKRPVSNYLEVSSGPSSKISIQEASPQTDNTDVDNTEPEEKGTKSIKKQGRPRNSKRGARGNPSRQSPRTATRKQMPSRSNQDSSPRTRIDKSLSDSPQISMEEDTFDDVLDGSSLSEYEQSSDDYSTGASPHNRMKRRSKKSPPPRPSTIKKSQSDLYLRPNPQPYMPTTIPFQSIISARKPPFPLFTLLQKPIQPTVTQEDRDWAETVMQFDSKLNRFRYAASDASNELSVTSRLILQEAFNANRLQMDRLKEEDFEFFGVIAETTSDLVKSFFDEQSIESIASDDLCNNSVTISTLSIDSGSLKPSARDRRTVNNPENQEVIVRKFIPPQHRAVQKRRCLLYKGAEICRPCISRQANNDCLFIDFRCFYVKSTRDIDYITKYKYGPDFFSQPRVDASYRYYKVDLGEQEANYIIAFIHSLSQALFTSESEHVIDASKNLDSETELVDYVRRPSQDRQYCELCKSSIVSGYWMCCVCGQDFCLDCFKTLCEGSPCTRHRLHKKVQFIPCGRFHLSTLTQSLDSLNSKVNGLPKRLLETARGFEFKPSTATKPLRARTEMEYRKPLVSSADSITLEEFRESWCRGEVIYLTGIGEHLKMDWSPKYLKAHHGKATVNTMDIQSQETENMTLEEYFNNYFLGKVTESARRMMEWPSDLFQDILEGHFRDLLQALPLRDYTRLRGAFNLVRYFPIGQIGVDLSPKLYPSQGLGPNCNEYGSIPISCEMSDSIYICVYENPFKKESSEASQLSSEGSSCAVIWDVYRAEDRRLVQKYIEQEIMAKRKSRLISDPFTFHSFYLSPQEQEKLYQENGVRPYQVMQNLGDAIMIPAGCVRQARYVHDAILVGLDFVSPERLGVTLDWHKEWRLLNLRRRCRRLADVLMAKDILFYTTLAVL